MKTVVFTSDKHSWLLRGFFHQWEKYGGLRGFAGGNGVGPEVEVAGFTDPGFIQTYARNAGFYSIGRFEDYPVNRWSDAIIKYLQSVDDDFVLILLEDYWLSRPIYQNAISLAHGYMVSHKDVIRFDLTTDRMFAVGSRYLGPYGMIDICEAKGAYSLSFQAGLYRRQALLEVMRPNESPWVAEINGTDRLNKLPYRVVGSYQWPINYAIVVNKGSVDTIGDWMVPARTLRNDDWRELKALGYLHPEGI